MALYIILSRFSPGAFKEPKDLKKLADNVKSKIQSECLKINWLESYATMGRYDAIDIVESDDPKQVEKAAMIIRSYGHSMTETCPATKWMDFMANL